MTQEDRIYRRTRLAISFSLNVVYFPHLEDCLCYKPSKKMFIAWIYCDDLKYVKMKHNVVMVLVGVSE